MLWAVVGLWCDRLWFATLSSEQAPWLPNRPVCLPPNHNASVPWTLPMSYAKFWNMIFRRVHKIAKSDCQLHCVCPSVRPNGTARLPYSILYSPWSRVLLKKLTGSQLVRKFPTYYGIRRFITAFTSARHLSLSWARSIESILPHHTWRSILMLSFHLRLGLPSGLFPSGFLTKTLHTPLISPTRATYRSHLILLDLIAWTILGEEYRS